MRSSGSTGFLAVTASFLFWGLTPLYWKPLHEINPWEIIAHRGIWTVAVTMVLLLAFRQRAELGAVFRSRKLLVTHGLAAILLGGNGVVYVWAVNSGQVLEASLAYFLVPVINLLTGLLFLNERLNRWQWLAALVALGGVLLKILATGALPVVALILSLSFGYYGFFRKKSPVGALAGLTVEMIMISVPGLAFLVYLEFSGQGAFGHSDLVTNGMLIGSGVITATPLLLFTFGTKRIPLVTVGVLQYLAPSVMFVLGWAFLEETLQPMEFAAFALIWAGLAVYTSDSVVRMRKKPLAMEPDPMT